MAAFEGTRACSASGSSATMTTGGGCGSGSGTAGLDHFSGSRLAKAAHSGLQWMKHACRVGHKSHTASTSTAAGMAVQHANAVLHTEPSSDSAACRGAAITCLGEAHWLDPGNQRLK